MSDDKDRLGDKLRKKERAEEDRYFAEQDREKMEKLRAQTAPKPTLGLCPRCGIALVQKDQLGVAIDECSQCRGVWLDAGELETIVERQDEGWTSRWVRSLLSRDS